jgi:hypothetical protein
MVKTIVKVSVSPVDSFFLFAVNYSGSTGFLKYAPLVNSVCEKKACEWFLASAPIERVKRVGLSNNLGLLECYIGVSILKALSTPGKEDNPARLGSTTMCASGARV